MDSSTKTIFKKLNNEDKYFSEILEKVTKGYKLSKENCSYVLSLSLLFYNEYLIKQKIEYMEFSYYLVLNYSLITNDYKPLLIFSVNNGLYPIAKCIFSNYDKTIQDVIVEEWLNLYKKNNIYELRKQAEARQALIDSKAQNRAYIAPTSYGKSSAIIEDILHNKTNKIGVIVPKKALIWQTFRSLKKLAKELNYKVLIHDADYNGEEKVICVFTQERALRLLQDSAFAFDTLYIDEAHNLFEKDERNILLARLIKLNKKINSTSRVVYLSPLIKEANDLIFNNNELIYMQKIDFNIKEVRVKFFSRDNTLEFYNRFLDSFYPVQENYNSYFDFIFHNLGNKNLFYFNTPRDIEKFSQGLLEKIKIGELSLPYNVNTAQLNEIAEIVSKYVDKDYNLVELIKYGVVFIHGKMPDSIKDYILTRFTTTDAIKILISNSSILEGMNLSLDTMFILDAFRLKQNDLINLCGRVNRLSDIFSSNDLSRLFCNIYFVDSGNKNVNFKNKISLLRSDIKDELKNPLLIKTKLDNDGAKIAKQEKEFIDNYLSNDIKTILVKNGVSYIYKNIDLIVNYIRNILSCDQIRKLDLITKISKVFFTDCDNVGDFELIRLKENKTILFYKTYVNKIYHLDLKNKISFFKSYFKTSSNEYFYIGSSFGEEASKYYPNNKVYVNVKNKTLKELVNLSVIKSKIEDDFVGYKLGKLVKTLFDLGLINEVEYNKFVYGTSDCAKLELIKMGVPQIIISFIEENNLKNNFKIENGMIIIDDDFKNILNKQDDYFKFEANKYIY